MKKNIYLRWLLIPCFLFLALCMAGGQGARAQEAGGEVSLSIEKFTIGQGYLVEPARVSFTAGQTVGELVLAQIKKAGYTPIMGTGAMYYMAGIEKADNGSYQVPACIQGMKSMGEGMEAPTGKEENVLSPDLCEHSYTPLAGWMYTVNGEAPTLALNEYKPQSGDVIRVQFTLYAYGGDLGIKYGDNPYLQLPDRDPMTDRLAVMNKYKAICDNKGYSDEYKAAHAAAINMDVSESTFNEAFNALPGESQILAWAKEEEAKKKYTPGKVTIKKAKAGKKMVKLTWKKISAASGYEISMSGKKSSGYKKIASIKKAGKVNYTKKKLKSKKAYFFRIRAYRTVADKTYYGAWSKVKKVKVK